MSKKKVLAKIRRAYTQGDWPAYAAAVVDLERILPRDYAGTLARESLLPRAVSAEMCVSMSHASNESTVRDPSRLFESLATIDERVSVLSQRTNQLPIWKTPFASVYQMAVQIQKQWRDLEHLGRTTMPDALLPQALLGDHVDIGNGARSSPTAMHEQMAEAFQLVLAHAHGVFGPEMNNMPATGAPLDERSLYELVALAQLWKIFEALRQRVIYLGWRGRQSDSGEWVFEPVDMAEFRRIEIGARRRLEQLTVVGTMVLQRFARPKDYHAALQAVIDSLHLPIGLQTWNGEIDRNALRQMSDFEPSARLDEITIDSFFYRPIADALVVGVKDIPWRLVVLVMQMLRVLAESFVARAKAEESHPQVFITDAGTLADLLADVCNITAERALDTVQVLTFDQGRRELEIWDTPLVPAPGRRLLLVPQLILNGMRLRALENFAAARNRNLFDRRGGALEDFLAHLFRSNEIPVQASVKLGKLKTECDVVVWWAGWLFLIEAKCTKSVFSPYDAYRGREAVEEASQQLVVRRNAILADWGAFRTSARDLNLPEEPVGAENIMLVAVTNVPHFTPLRVGDVIVTDDWCLQRFFDDPAVTLVGQATPDEVLGYIRADVPISPELLIEHLAAPYQVRMAAAGLSEVMQWVPSIDDKSPVLITHAVYEPPLVEKALQRLHERASQVAEP
jgi:hypothetical protein